MGSGRPQKGPLKILDAIEWSIGASAITGLMEGYTPNVIWLDAAGTVTLSVNGRSLPFSPAAGLWHPMPNFTHITAGTATGIKVGVAL